VCGDCLLDLREGHVVTFTDDGFFLARIVSRRTRGIFIFLYPIILSRFLRGRWLRLRWQWHEVGVACGTDVEFLASEVCGLLRHQAACDEFAAGDGDEVVDAVVRLVVDADDASADASAGGVVAVGDEGSDA